MAEPRTWAVPEIPADVQRVRDCNSVVWRRYGQNRDWWMNANWPGAENCDGQTLLTQRGPLTEVVSDVD